MLIETALMTYLLAQTGITSLVGQRIDFGEAKQTVVKPYIVFFKVSQPGSHTQDGAIGIGNPHYQINVFSLTYGQAHQIAAAVKSALDSYQGTMGGVGGVYVHSCLFDDESDYVNTEISPMLFTVIQDYYINCEE